MATDGISAALAVRSSVGVELWSSSGLKVPYSEHPQFTRDVSKFCVAAAYSPDGRYLAWVNGVVVNICSTADWTIVRTLPRPKACYLQFSPSGNYLMTYESFFTTKECPNGSHNLYVYDANTGAQVYSVVQKKQSGWQPVWSLDESIMALMLGGEAFFFETAGPSGFQKHVKKIGSTRNGSLSVAPNAQQPFVAFCVPGTKGGPTQCRIYKYPDLQAAQPVGFRSFYQADSVEMLWNRRGTGLLLLTSTDVDQTGASYYGKQALHYISTKGDSYSVQLSKEGSVHAVSWNPNSGEFCVVYGFMPAKATFYNLKCDVSFEAGEGDRNSIYYNDFGTLVILAGFGNLSGKVEVWDVQKKKLVSSFRAPDTTQLEWCPNGELFVTATTAPRLRVGNCFKVWHYSGALLHETLWPAGQGLFEVAWQRFPAGTFTAKPVSSAKVEGIKSSQPLASAEPYRPPGARGIVIPPLTPKAGQNRPAGVSADGGGGGAAAGTNNNTSTNPISRRDRRTERNKTRATNFRKKFENGDADTSSVSAPELSIAPDGNVATKTTTTATTATTTPEAITNNGTCATATNGTTAAAAAPDTLLSPEEWQRVKRTRIVSKKLSDISKLKARKEKGEHLEINQMAKITGEAELQKELAELRLA